MTMKKHINQALKILTKVFGDATYSNMAFYGENVSDMATKLVYGVLENNVKIEYIISQLAPKKPQNTVYYILKIGTCALLSLDNVPEFAIVSECVECAKMNGKGGASGFINAVLKRVAQKAYKLPQADDKSYLSITYSKPQWFVDKLVGQYGKEKAIEIISTPSYDLEHVRINNRLSSIEEIENILKKAKCAYTKTAVGGLSVRADKTISRLFDKGELTYQSASSMLAVQALGIKDGSMVLDVCSAPGGKAVYMSELNPHGKIVACDLHPHRVSLIQKYKQRMHSPNVKAVQADASILNEYWVDKFDCVLVDAPCSCLGTFNKHPDVFLNKQEDDIYELAKTQKNILKTASHYVKKGGYLLYSTCTLFDEENAQVVKCLLEEGSFTLERIESDLYSSNDGMIQVLPHDEWDGFFIARMKRTN